MNQISVTFLLFKGLFKMHLEVKSLDWQQYLALKSGVWNETLLLTRHNGNKFVYAWKGLLAAHFLKENILRDIIIMF